MSSEIYQTKKEMANALGRSRDYVEDMIRGGFLLPATLMEAVQFIRANGPVSRFRLRSTLKKSEIWQPVKINFKQARG